MAGQVLWYADGRAYSTKDTPFAEMPEDGVLVRIIYFEEKNGAGLRHRELQRGYDWYFTTPEGICGGNNDSAEEITRRYPGAVLKRGIWAATEEFARICGEADARMDL